MWRRVACLALCVAASVAQFHLSPDLLSAFLGTTGDESPKNLNGLVAQVAGRVHTFAEELLASPDLLKAWLHTWEAHETPYVAFVEEEAELLTHETALSDLLQDADMVSTRFLTRPAPSSAEDVSFLTGNPYPFWAFLPLYRGAAVPGAEDPLKVSGLCFHDLTMSVGITTNSTTDLVLEVIIKAHGPKGTPFCTERLLLTTFEGIAYKALFLPGEYRFAWKVAERASDAQRWDVLNRGVRLSLFTHDILELLVDVYETARLFIQPLTDRAVKPEIAALNAYMVNTYTRLPRLIRRVGGIVDVPEELVEDGDMFSLVRMAGLDSMLDWAQGSTSSHVTVAMRIGGQLYVLESTTNDSSWDVNGIQKTPYRQWLAQAEACSDNVVWLLLAKDVRGRLDPVKAAKWFSTVEGLDYGYHNILWSWIDTPKDNYPCLPPDFTHCLAYETGEWVFATTELIMPSAADLLFTESMNKRLNTTGLRAVELLNRAWAAGLGHGEFPAIPEQDEWRYNTTRFDEPVVGESHVCSTFVCSVLKHGGVFGDTPINCNEVTNHDIHSFRIFDEARVGSHRPETCLRADPQNQLCQLMGDYELHLNDFNVKPVFAHVAEKCPSKGPDYKLDMHC